MIVAGRDFSFVLCKWIYRPNSMGLAPAMSNRCLPVGLRDVMCSGRRGCSDSLGREVRILLEMMMSSVDKNDMNVYVCSGLLDG